MTKFVAFDAAETLDTPEAIAEFLQDALETDDEAYITHAIGVVARARGMSDIADAAGVARTSLYRSLSPEGHPSFMTVHRVFDALGVRLGVLPKEPANAH
jgi:probable addiction module antidote protein